MRLSLFSILLTLTVCAAPDPGSDSAPPPAFTTGRTTISILFIGNSLTYSNDLPELVKEIAAMDNTTVTFKSIAVPNYSLEDHWNDGQAQKEIASKKYDIVIGQQGPSALPESQVLLKQFAAKFADACAKAGTSWGLYMVWPTAARSFDLDNVIYSYTQAAKTTSGLLCPAGLAWKNAWKEDPAMPLYGPDQFHPSVAGSVLAAMTVYAALQAKDSLDFIDLTKFSWKEQVTAAQFDLMKRSALKAVKTQ